jgi:hypothetical protein
MYRVAIGSPLSPVIANFSMEDFKENALNTANHKPLRRFQHVDNMFTIWSQVPERLDGFLVNHSNIQFTMETEIEGYLPILDTDVYRRPDGSLRDRL